jgi:hypothetical protein
VTGPSITNANFIGQNDPNAMVFNPNYLDRPMDGNCILAVTGFYVGLGIGSGLYFCGFLGFPSQIIQLYYKTPSVLE